MTWANVFYTLTPTTGTNSNYGSNCDITIEGITWNVTGNSQLIPWRIGGKGITQVDRTVYSKTGMSSAANKVDLTVGGASSITVHSLKLTVSTDANFSTVIDNVTKSFSANSTISFTPTTGTEWPSGAFYKFTFNVSVNGSNNKFVEFSKVEFMSSSNKQDPNLKWMKDGAAVSNSTQTITLGNDFVAPTLQKAADFTETITYSSDNNDVATISNNGIVSIVGAGQTVIKASFVGNDNWTASSAQYTLKVEKRMPNIQWSTDEYTYVQGEPLASPTLTIPSDFDGTIRYSSTVEAVATINANSGDLTIRGIGTTTIKAVVTEDDNWKSQTVSYTLKVSRSPAHVSAFNEVFYESFNDCDGTGGNDGNWSGSIASNNVYTDHDCWEFVKEGGAYECVKIGTGSYAGSAKMTIILEAGEYQLGFDAGAWRNDPTTLNISATGAKLNTTSFTLEHESFTSYSAILTVASKGSVSITFTTPSKARFFLDEVVLNITKVSIPMNADGIRTYASVYGLDFSQVEGLTAYYATGYDKTNLSLTMTPMDVTAPGAGMMLKGAANTTYTVPVATSGSTTTTQYLVGLTDATNVLQMDAEGNTTFILAKVNGVINWYKLREDNYTLKANSAYLRLPADAIPQGQNPVVMDFTGGSNGISTATATATNNESWYTLDGRLLQSKPSTKGIYVNNGRKIVIK